MIKKLLIEMNTDEIEIDPEEIALGEMMDDVKERIQDGAMEGTIYNLRTCAKVMWKLTIKRDRTSKEKKR